MTRILLPAALLVCYISLARASDPSAPTTSGTTQTDDEKKKTTTDEQNKLDLSSLSGKKDPGVTGDALLKKWGEDPNMKGFIDNYRFESIQKLIDGGYVDQSKLPSGIKDNPDAIKYGAVQYDKDGKFMGVTVLMENGGMSLMPTKDQEAFFANGLNARDTAEANEASSRLAMDQTKDTSVKGGDVSDKSLLAGAQNNPVGSNSRPPTPGGEVLAGAAGERQVGDSNRSLADNYRGAGAGASGVYGGGGYGGNGGYAGSGYGDSGGRDNGGGYSGFRMAGAGKSPNDAPSGGGGSLEESGPAVEGNGQNAGLNAALASALREQKDAWRTGSFESRPDEARADRPVDAANRFENGWVSAYEAVKSMAKNIFSGPDDGARDRSSKKFDGGSQQVRKALEVASGGVSEDADGHVNSQKLLGGRGEMVVVGERDAEVPVDQPRRRGM